MTGRVESVTLHILQGLEGYVEFNTDAVRCLQMFSAKKSNAVPWALMLLVNTEISVAYITTSFAHLNLFCS